MELVTTEQINSLKILADTNLKISEAKNTLLKLQEEEKEYLQKREEEVHLMIAKVLDDSKDLLEETKYNYKEVKNFHNVTLSFSDFLKEMYEKYRIFVEGFNERSDLWNEIYNKQIEEIGELRKDIDKDNEEIKRKNKTLEEDKEKLKKDRRHVESQQQTLETSYKELKKLWTLQKKN